MSKLELLNRTFKNSKHARSFKLLKISLAFLVFFLIFCLRSLALGYFPPPRFSQHRDHSSFWSNNKRKNSLSDRQKTLIKETLKELSKAGVKKSARSKCVQDIAKSLLPVTALRSSEIALLAESARCCADNGEPDLAEALTQCSLKMFEDQGSKDEDSSYSRSQSLDNLAGLQLSFSVVAVTRFQ